MSTAVLKTIPAQPPQLPLMFSGRVVRTPVTSSSDGIARGVEAQPRRDGALIALCVVVVEEAEVLSERRLQPRVTLTDVHRVAVVGDVEQVAHRGLVSPGIILHTHLADLTALPAEVDGRGEVRHRTRGIGMKPLVVLGEVGLLRHEAHAGIEVERLPHDAQDF